MRTQVRKIGNSLGNIIPSAMVRQLELKEGSELEVKSEGGKIIIEPIKRHRPKFISEDELLSGNIYTADDNLLPTTHLDNEWID
ncbi:MULTISPECIES: AbrB/MazE/SpoVT family DNA-binding domain-containing protein [Vibrio]|uniref:AbrB/MazE/SpoVT family DNA-binding domain-containing protein n=1 Tax=Vibrio TaxID=662 RepID=UPI000D012150|nr:MULTISPECIES: AbrB/MazE/SpoVT family DNA-binding domain-containing protein [Vibrio]